MITTEILYVNQIHTDERYFIKVNDVTAPYLKIQVRGKEYIFRKLSYDMLQI